VNIKQMMITKEGGDPWRESSWREILRGAILSVDRLLLGEKAFAERSSPWRDFSVERSALRRGSSRRDSLHGESSRGERSFKERLSPWRNLSKERWPSRRGYLCGENLRGERSSGENPYRGSRNLNLIVTVNHFGIRNGISSSPNQDLEKNNMDLHITFWDRTIWLPTKTGKSNNPTNYRVHCLPISHRHDFSVAFDATLSDATGWYSSNEPP
jgi:hypothetical protein